MAGGVKLENRYDVDIPSVTRESEKLFQYTKGCLIVNIVRYNRQKVITLDDT